MRRDEVLRRLRERKDDLRRAGIVRLRLFGSTARGDARENSDVDLLVDLDMQRPWSLFSVGGLQFNFTEILESEVDLAVAPWLRKAYADQILQEAVDVF